MKLVIDATEVAEELDKCKPGDQKMITITVGSKDGDTITGDATAVEYVTGEEDYEEEEDEEMEEEMKGKMHGKMGRKVPKAILLVARK